MRDVSDTSDQRPKAGAGKARPRRRAVAASPAAAPAADPAAQGPAGSARFSNDGPRSHDNNYSRFVALTKVVLPVAAAFLIALVAIWPHLRPSDSRFSLSFASLTPQEISEPSMVNPRYVGTDENRQVYSVTADIARAVGEGVSTVELEMPKADMTLEDGTWLVLTADTGVFKRDGDILDLDGAVNLFHDSGYEFRTRSARIELSKGIAHGTQPIQGQGSFGELEAEGFRIEGRGDTVVFTGRSRLLIEDVQNAGNAE
ncbi:MAG: LPS export ABC transporter periplasmic protein LptC [Magnetovibrionaceae bacterium]